MTTKATDHKTFSFYLISLLAALVTLIYTNSAQGIGNLERGKAIYNGHCASCHGISGDGNGPRGDGLNPPPTNFLDTAVMKALADNDLQRVILQGKPETAMSGYGTILRPDELDAVIVYIRSLSSVSP